MQNFTYEFATLNPRNKDLAKQDLTPNKILFRAEDHASAVTKQDCHETRLQTRGNKTVTKQDCRPVVTRLSRNKTADPW